MIPACWGDDLSDDALHGRVVSFVKDAQEPTLTVPEIDDYYATITPRSVFFKNIVPGGKLLDLGAGDGMMSVFRDWPAFKRTDIGMYAVSLAKGERFDQYDGYELGNFDDAFPDFGGRPFDAVLCAHFIEHIKDPERCIRWIAERLKPDGRLYLEWPHSVSKRMPSSSVFKALGLDVSTTRFSDDATHIEAWNIDLICGLLHRYGLMTEIVGRTHYPYLARAMRDVGIKTRNQVYGTFAIWGFVGWAQYVVAAKR